MTFTLRGHILIINTFMSEDLKKIVEKHLKEMKISSWGVTIIMRYASYSFYSMNNVNRLISEQCTQIFVIETTIIDFCNIMT